MTPFHRPAARAATTAPLALALFLAAAGPASAAEFTLVHVNDLDRFEEQDGRGGYARLAAALKELRAERPNVIVTHGGDMISPSLLSGLDHGAHIIALNNAVGINVSTLGNHEFDFGPAVLKQRLTEARYPYVNANVQQGDQVFPGTVTGLLRPVGEIVVGFFGLTTPDTVELASPGPDVIFRDPVAAAADAVMWLREQGADVIVALTHQDIADDMRVAGIEGVDFILGGHDHEPMSILLGDTLIFKSGAQAEYVGVVDVEATVEQTDRGPETVVERKWSVVPTREYAPDPEMQALVDHYAGQLDEELNVPVGTAGVELDTRRLSVRTVETNFGNLVADATREATGADLAITNGGGIRGDRTYPAGTTLTRRDVLSELPFGNRTVLLEVTGQQVLDALENGFSQVEERAGRFPQVSGMTVTYDPTAPAGQRVREVLVGDRPLDPAATYTLATNDYMAGGGDGYAVFKGTRQLIDPAAARLMATQVMEYIQARGGVAPRVEGRIIEARS